jgi:hypothetical protein
MKFVDHLYGTNAPCPRCNLLSDASRGVEGPGPMTLRQPTARHGGNAGIDEEIMNMELKAIASFDARLEHAKEVQPGSLRHPSSEFVADSEFQCGESIVIPTFEPSTEPWADYFRWLYPNYASPINQFVSWKYSTTGVDVSRALWMARERVRSEWISSHGQDSMNWLVSHPPLVLWLPNVAYSACLRCSWIGSGTDSSPISAGTHARQHSVDHGCEPQMIQQLRVPISERNGPIDQPLRWKWV